MRAISNHRVNVQNGRLMVCRASVPEESRAVAPRTGPQLDENTIANAESTLRKLGEHDLLIWDMFVIIESSGVNGRLT